MVENDPGKYPTKMGTKWDNIEIHNLLLMVQQKKSIQQIAEEHQRTTGAISAQLRKLAYEYWANHKKPIEEISAITGLSRSEIEEVIKKKTEFQSKDQSCSSETREMIEILKDIQSKLSIIAERFC